MLRRRDPPEDDMDARLDVFRRAASDENAAIAVAQVATSPAGGDMSGSISNATVNALNDLIRQHLEDIRRDEIHFVGEFATLYDEWQKVERLPESEREMDIEKGAQGRESGAQRPVLPNQRRSRLGERGGGPAENRHSSKDSSRDGHVQIGGGDLLPRTAFLVENAHAERA